MLHQRMDWNDLKFFLMVARHRTLSAAAVELGVTQPTVGRRLSALEARLGAKLFERRSDGFLLSGSGRRILAHAESMEADALAAERRVRGRDEGVTGTVRVTASEWVVTGVLAPLLAPLLLRHAALTVELVSDTRHLNLARRDADVAFRPRRFEHQEIVQRSTCKLGFAVYATKEYLVKRGVPSAGDGQGHALVLMSDDVGDVARAWLHGTLPNAHVAARTNGRDAMLALAASSAGLACLARVVGDERRDLERVDLPGSPTPTLWMGVHRDGHGTPRVRAVTSHLAAQLKRHQSRLSPAA